MASYTKLEASSVDPVNVHKREKGLAKTKAEPLLASGKLKSVSFGSSTCAGSRHPTTNLQYTIDLYIYPRLIFSFSFYFYF